MPPGTGGHTPEPSGNSKKKRRTSTAPTNHTQSSPVPDLVPPPLSGYGDTVVASNPFDDTPQRPPQTSMGMGLGPPMGPGSMPPGSMGPRGMMHPIQHHNMNPNSLGMPPGGMPHDGMGQGGIPPNSMSVMSPCGPMPPHMMGPGMSSKPMPVSAGKIYPVDQPMVFNPQNPNAPPIYPCGICHKEVHDNDQAILCESGCNFWFHRVCTGLTEAAYHLLTAEVYAEWVCDKCLTAKNIPLVKFKP